MGRGFATFGKRVVTGSAAIPGLFRKNIGCYADPEGKDMPARLRGDRWRPNKCRKACKSRKYRYAAVTRGGVCLCGNSFGRYGKVSQEYCRNRCRTRSVRKCGGRGYNSVYALHRRGEINRLARRKRGKIIYYGKLPAPLQQRFHVPKHPFMSNVSANSMHGDSYATDVHRWAGPVGPNIKMRHKSYGLTGMCLTFIHDSDGHVWAICVG